MPDSDLQREGTTPAAPRPKVDESTGGGLSPGAGLTPPGHPAQIGRFEVRQILGEGAFGRVYRAFDPGLQREVAIKVPHQAGLTPAFRERFLREARATATIHHPNVCPVYEVGTEGDLPYIVMHFVRGSTLAGLLAQRRSPFPPRYVVAIIRKLALGVTAAHDKGVIHRDLKPQNVLWDEASREVLVTDFGLARIGEAQMTSEGQTLGTPAYMSPEQARGTQSEVGPLSDVYSLGVILYRLLTGELPFQGSAMEVLAQAQFAKPRPPSAIRPELDPRLDAVCLKAMAKNPEDRFPSAKALADSLADYLKGVPASGAAELVDRAEIIEEDTEKKLSLPRGDEVLVCPKCKARLQVSQGRTKPIVCPLCEIRFSVNAGRKAAERLASAKDIAVEEEPIGSQASTAIVGRPVKSRARQSSGRHAHQPELDLGKNESPSEPREEWLPVARGLRMSWIGMVLTGVCLIGSVVTVATSPSIPPNPRSVPTDWWYSSDRSRYDKELASAYSSLPPYRGAYIAFGAGQALGLILMGVGRRRATRLPAGISEARSAWIGRFAVWGSIACLLAPSGLIYDIFYQQQNSVEHEQTLILYTLILSSLGIIILMLGELLFYQYLNSVNYYLGARFEKRIRTRRILLQLIICFTLISGIAGGVWYAVWVNHHGWILNVPGTVASMAILMSLILIMGWFPTNVWLHADFTAMVNRLALGEADDARPS